MQRMGSGWHAGRLLGPTALFLALLLAGIDRGGAQSVCWAPRYAMTLGADGNLYGTTSVSVNGYGAIYRMAPSGKLTTLHNFDLNDGSYPNGLTLGRDGYLYGTTRFTIFKIKPGGAFTSLYIFPGTVGLNPSDLTQGRDGNFYGTALYGGANGAGTVFKITPSGSFTTLYNFTGGTDGAYPYALTLGKDGNFYGTAQDGGTTGNGTVFKITPSGTLTTPYSFTGGSDGAHPLAGLTPGKDGEFYGTTGYGGANQRGVLFKITPSGSLTTLYSFTGGSDGGAPAAVLTLGKDGNVYGTNNYGGTAGDGVMFQLTPSGTLTVLSNFTSGGASSYLLQAGLTAGDDGNLYGVTQAPVDIYAGPPVSGGTIFQIAPSGILTTLHTFTWGGYGWRPFAALTQGENGDFYGTAWNGGANNSGVVFTITPDGKQRVLHNFDSEDGANPVNALTVGRDHNLYGVTPNGGTTGNGTIYRMTPAGGFTTLYNFTGGNDGANPYAALTLGNDGSFYGTAQNGGATGNGTVFKITRAGKFILLYTFTSTSGGNNTDGADPNGTLALGTDGNLYGGTSYGGAFGSGTLFKITPSGTLTVLYSFTGGNDGSGPAYLTLGGDGNLYGTTQYGGADGSGNVFQLTPTGGFTNLYTFTGGSDGGGPNGLTLGPDGSFYGTTQYGTTFQVTTAGTLTVLGTPYPNWINSSLAGLTLGKDGNFYGTWLDSEYYSGGGIFRMTAAGALTFLWSFGN